jgi:hypothetical protein
VKCSSARALGAAGTSLTTLGMDLNSPVSAWHES